MTEGDLYDKRRGQRMLLTKWIRTYNSTDDEAQRERAARKLAEVLEWARSVGMSSTEIAEDRELPNRALELQAASTSTSSAIDEAEIREAEREIASAVDTTDVTRMGEGPSSVYAYGYSCAPDRLKIGRTDRDVITRIVNQINESTPDRPVLHLVISTGNAAALERALHGALTLRRRNAAGGGREWYRTTVSEIVTIYEALVGTVDQAAEI